MTSKRKPPVPYKIPTITNAEKRKRKIKDFILFLLPFFILFLLTKVFFVIGIVPSASMFPLMNTDSGIIANRFSYSFSNPKRGDVIIFRKSGSVMTKRIIGIPGDTISIQNGLVYINEQPTVETYISEGITTEAITGINHYIVPDSSYFVLGDNRINSNDSRSWDLPYVPEQDVIAKVLCVFSINPLSHGFYYRGVNDIRIEETYSGVPPFSRNNIITETIPIPSEDNGLNDNNAVDSSPKAPTLPVSAIAPETMLETESSAGAEESSSENESASNSLEGNGEDEASSEAGDDTSSLDDIE